MTQTVTNLPTIWETQVQSSGWEDSLEKGMAIHSSILAWRIPWREEPGGLQSMGSHRVGPNWATKTSRTWTCPWPADVSSRPLLSERHAWSEEFLSQESRLCFHRDRSGSLERSGCLREHGLHRLKPTELKPPQEFCSVTRGGQCTNPWHASWLRSTVLEKARDLGVPASLLTSVQFSRSAVPNSLWPHEL